HPAERSRPLPARSSTNSKRGSAATRGNCDTGRRPVSRGRTARVGVFGIGLAAYWPQFDGLHERLQGYQQGIERRLEEMGAEAVSAGLVDSPQGARRAGDELAAAADIDLVLVYTATYATSSQVLPVVQAVAKPVVILNLQPTRTVDYERMTTGEWLANCSACCVPGIPGALTRAGGRYPPGPRTPRKGRPASA